MNDFGFVDNEGQIINLSGQMFNTEYYWGAAKDIKQGLDDGLLDSDEDNWSRLAQSYQLAGKMRWLLTLILRQVN